MTAAREPKGRAGKAVVLAERYRLETRVAAGGMGEVWRATDMLLERTVAVKLLRESLAEDPVVSERFRREALMAAGLSHPNMADVYDYVQEDGRPGIVMEYVEGETLAERIARDGALDVGDAVRITSALLAVLQAAHDAGIVHRDVKPGNVILCSNSDVKVTDFGIARAAGHETLTETGMVVGTAHYLSPEQVSGRPATPASDLYSAGAILYEMLTGKRPFDAETPLAVAMQRLSDDPIAPREHDPGIPEPVEQVALRALSRDPQGRYASADGMRSALEAAQAAGQPATVPRRMDPTPTQVLPVADLPDALDTPTVTVRAAAAKPPAPAMAPAPARAKEPPPVTGSSPAAAVAERRRNDYRRAIAWAVLLAVGVGIAAWALLAGSAGPVPVPDFKGMQITRARAVASDLGLQVAEQRQDSDRPAGEVIGQDIPAQQRVAEGETISLVVSTGTPPEPPCCTVPDLRGLTEEDARAAIEDAGLEVGKVTYVKTDQLDPGIVIDQSPGDGETKTPGTEVDMLVSEEPKRGKGNDEGNKD